MQIDNRTSDYRVWNVIVFVLAGILLATELMERPGFWSNYARDLVGPPLIYILFRGLHRTKRSRKSPHFRTPNVAAAFVLGFCFVVEAAQYLGLYSAHFDPYDLVAYVSGVLPIYVADRWRQSTHAPFTDSRQTTPP